MNEEKKADERRPVNHGRRQVVPRRTLRFLRKNPQNARGNSRGTATCFPEGLFLAKWAPAFISVCVSMRTAPVIRQEKPYIED